MRQVQQLSFCLSAIFALAASCDAKEWRGIVPLHSTKSDVVRLLGPSTDTDETRSLYHLESEDVLIVFSGREFCNSKDNQIPPGTVLMMQVTPRKRSSIESFRVQEKNWREFRPSADDENWRGFINAEDGVVVRTFKDCIDSIFYLPLAAKRISCPTYYKDLEELARIVVDFSERAFDRYEDLPFAEEKARLDNFAIYLGDKPTWKAYIVAHPGKTDEDARSRLKRAKQYLISLGVSEDRISAIIGAGRDKIQIELYALPPEALPPRPDF